MTVDEQKEGVHSMFLRKKNKKEKIIICRSCDEDMTKANEAG